MTVQNSQAIQKLITNAIENEADVTNRAFVVEIDIKDMLVPFPDVDDLEMAQQMLITDAIVGGKLKGVLCNDVTVVAGNWFSERLEFICKIPAYFLTNCDAEEDRQNAAISELSSMVAKVITDIFQNS